MRHIRKWLYVPRTVLEWRDKVNRVCNYRNCALKKSKRVYPPVILQIPTYHCNIYSSPDIEVPKY